MHKAYATTPLDPANPAVLAPLTYDWRGMYSRTGSSSGGSARFAPAGDSVLVVLLGEVALRRDGALAPVPGTRSRLLVAALATHPGRSRSAQALIDDIWGEDPPRAPMNALHTQVSRLRTALPEGALEIGPAGYRLMLAPDQVDLTLAGQLEKQARQADTAGDFDTCLALIAAARTLWRGDPAADLPSGPVGDELTRLAETRRRALDALELSAREACGDLPGALELARREVAANPMDEPAHATLMRLLVASGRANEALEVFAALRTHLLDHLGVDPGPALVAMNAAILCGEPVPGARGASASGGSGTEMASPAPVPDGQAAPPAPGGSDHAAGQRGSAGRADAGQRQGAGDSVTAAGSFLPGVRTSGEVGASYVVAQGYSGEPERTGETAAWAVGLRAAPNPLLGREADLDALEAVLRRSRVTTVLGPGGTGKTRVVNELGARLAGENSVVLVELASVRVDPGGGDRSRAEVEAAIGATLGIGELSRDTNVLRPVGSHDSRRRLREVLASRPMLLILDNCEHVIDAVAEVAADLVGVSDQLTVLTTSRAPLEITAETVYPLPPLTIDPAGSPATELFAARARAVRPSVRLDPEVVARLCHTIDGLPLAIELAAARVRTMSVEEIETRIEHRFALLRSGDRSSPQRHRTLHAVIEWSWNLLDEQQRVALRRLCRFPAGFTLRAAETVIAGPEIADAESAIEGLVGQSLLTVLEADPDADEGVRYRMLETVREFGEEQLGFTGEAERVMDRMSAWAKGFALEAATRYPTGEQVRAVLTTAAELDNLVAVLRDAVEREDLDTAHAVFPVLAGLWVIRGAHMELINWAPRYLALPLRSGPLTEIEADLQIFGQLVVSLHLIYMDDNPRLVGTVRARIRRALRSSASITPVFRYVGGLATLPVRAGGFGLARYLGDGTRSADRSTRETALLLRANLRENAGDVHGSIRDAVRAMASGSTEDAWGTAMVSQHLGSMYGQTARYAESVDYYRRAAELLHRLRAYEESVEIRSLLALSLTGMGDTVTARRELEPALGVVGLSPTGTYAGGEPNHRRAAVVAGLAEIELAEGDIDSGLRRYRQVLAQIGWPHGAITPGPGDVMFGAVVVDAHILHGRATEVHKLVRELVELAIPRLGQFRDLPQIGGVACALGTYLLATGENRETALELLALAPRVVARQDYPSMRLDRHYELHRATVGAERLAAARNAVARVGRRPAAARVMELLGEFHESH
ncbi:AfsR/SARP family transcriptional regulator [Nocardia crassostreae]|uniref:AfsR/SARP family transcriptional regulator n=1 Tax=Nocardia crassostreae TaxID=53428 RepID=UPI001FDF3654|nr:BTAD domain-containing putative transcriptional regulator [Nocardia crassostreae]